MNEESFSRGKNDNEDKRLVKHSWDIMRVDDLSKVLTLDPYMGFSTRKIYKNIDIPSEIPKELNKIISKLQTTDNKEVKKVEYNLIELVKKYKLCYYFNISSLSWLEPSIKLYVQVLSSDSMVLIVECNRYSGDNYNGIKVIAKKFIKIHTKINVLHGFHKTIDHKAKEFLETQQLDFSVMKSSRTKKSLIMLGPAALVNHDCNPNCEYESASKGSIKIKTIKSIQAGEELFCFYGTDYFNKNNALCECKTCELKKEGSFSKTSRISKCFAPLNMNKRRDSIAMDLSNIDSTEKTNDLQRCITSTNTSDSGSTLIPIEIRESKKHSVLNDEVEIINTWTYLHQDLLGFSGYKKLDSKLNQAFVKLYKLDISVTNRSKCTDVPCEILHKQIIVEDQYLTNKRTGYSFCIFCEEYKTQLPRHMKLVHSDQGIVEKILNGNDVILRNAAISFLRSQGYAHLEQLTGIVIPAKSIKKNAKTKVIKVQCDNCLGYFSSKTLLSHQRNCMALTIDKLRNFLK